MSAPSFEASINHEGGRAAVVCRGELDVSTTGVLEEALAGVIGTNPPAIHLDCSAVTFIESGGFDVLRALAQTCRARGINLEISFNARARKLVQTLGLNEQLLPRETRRLRDVPPQPTR